MSNEISNKGTLADIIATVDAAGWDHDSVRVYDPSEGMLVNSAVFCGDDYGEIYFKVESLADIVAKVSATGWAFSDVEVYWR